MLTFDVTAKMPAGRSTESSTFAVLNVVPVLTAEQALIQMIGTLDQVIAGTTNASLKKLLLDARKALQWNGASGALDMLRLKNSQAALVKLGQALTSLRAAQAAGANVGTLIALIEQVMASLR